MNSKVNLSHMSSKKERNNWRLAMWDITYFCNLSCKHCYNFENVISSENNYHPLSLAQSKIVVDNIFDMGFDEINLAGGEPLSNPNIIDLVDYIKTKGMIPSINTNGTLLHKGVINKFIDLDFTNFSFSIAGISRKTHSIIRGEGNFDLLLRNINNLINQINIKGISNRTSLNFSISSSNLGDLPLLYNFCTDLGVPHINVHLTQPMGAAVKNFEIIESDYELILLGYENLITHWGKDVGLTIDTRPIIADYLCKKYRLKKNNALYDCPAGDRNIYVRPDGEILSCKLQGISNKSFGRFQQLIPNINKNIFVENPIKDNKYKKLDICKTCKFNDICTPCPLISREIANNECEIGQKYSIQYDSEMLSMKLKIVPDTQLIKDDKNSSILINNQRKFKITDSGIIIWQNISNKVTLLELLRKVHSQIHHISDEEIIEFVLQLRNNGLIIFYEETIDQLPISCLLICCAR